MASFFSIPTPTWVRVRFFTSAASPPPATGFEAQFAPTPTPASKRKTPPLPKIGFEAHSVANIGDVQISNAGAPPFGSPALLEEDCLKIYGTFNLPFNREKTYQNLHDPVVLSRCVPSCDAFEKIGEDEYAVEMKLSLTAFSGLFAGKIKITDAHPPQSFTMVFEGSGKIGFLKGEGLINLSPINTGTELSYDGDVQVGGTIASVGQRVIDTTAKMMIRRFFEEFIKEVNTKR